MKTVKLAFEWPDQRRLEMTLQYANSLRPNSGVVRQSIRGGSLGKDEAVLEDCEAEVIGEMALRLAHRHGATVEISECGECAQMEL